MCFAHSFQSVGCAHSNPHTWGEVIIFFVVELTCYRTILWYHGQNLKRKKKRFYSMFFLKKRSVLIFTAKKRKFQIWTKKEVINDASMNLITDRSLRLEDITHRKGCRYPPSESCLERRSHDQRPIVRVKSEIRGHPVTHLSFDNSEQTSPLWTLITVNNASRWAF